MPFIDKIPLSEIKPLRYLRDAKVGTFVQVAQASVRPAAITVPASGPQAPMTALVSVLSAANGERTGLVILEGTEAGTFYGDDELMQRPALDISGLADVVVTEPAPSGTFRKVLAGDICLAYQRNGDGVLSMAVSFDTSSSIKGYVPLHGPQRGRIGTITDQVYVGRGAVISNKVTVEP